MSAVIHVITALERGGAQRNTLDTVTRLHHPRRPQLLVAGPGGALAAEARALLGHRFLEVPSLVHPLSPLADARALSDLTRLFARVRERLRAPIVVHTHSSKAGVVGRLAAASAGLPAIHTVHGFGVDALGPKLRDLLIAAERAVDPLTRVAIFVSEGDLDVADELRLFTRADRRVIRSGIDEDAFRGCRTVETRGRARASLGINDDAPVAVTIANLKPQKDPLFHVDVLAAWRRRSPRAQLVFVGDGPLRSAVERVAAERGVRDALHLVGFVEDVRPYLAAADVFLLASAWEGLPRSVLEATAAGLPAVVRDTGWAGDLGFAVSVTALDRGADADAFASALAQRHRRPPRRLPRAFTRAGMLDELRALYDELCGPVVDDDELSRLRRRRRRR